MLPSTSKASGVYSLAVFECENCDSVRFYSDDDGSDAAASYVQNVIEDYKAFVSIE